MRADKQTKAEVRGGDGPGVWQGTMDLFRGLWKMLRAWDKGSLNNDILATVWKETGTVLKHLRPSID